MPDLPLPMVDVADVMRVHLAALAQERQPWQAPPGLRRVCASRDRGLLKQRHPKRRIGDRVAPKADAPGLAVFDASIRMNPSPRWGARSTSTVGQPLRPRRPFIPPEEAIAAFRGFRAAQARRSKAA